MGKKPIIISFIIILLIIGGVVFLLNSAESQQTSEKTTDQSDSKSEPSAEIRDQPAPQPPSGAYVDYSEKVITETSGTKLLFFHAPWCPQCRALESDIKASGVPAGVTIIKVDYDSNQALRQKYGVTLQTTIVRVDDQGGLVKKYVAYGEPTLEAVKENIL